MGILKKREILNVCRVIVFVLVHGQDVIEERATLSTAFTVDHNWFYFRL